MKKLIISIVTTWVMLTFATNTSTAATTPISNATIAQSEEARHILARMEQIKAMDKTSMTASQKRELRKEVRSTKRQMDSSGGGVYLSVGAVILIIILLIILL